MSPRPSSDLLRAEGKANPKGKPCPLCSIPQSEVLAEYRDWKLVRTKTMKGHRERLMLFHKKHLGTLDESSVGEAYLLLSQLGAKFFSFTDKWAIFDPAFATVPDHWHRIASDLEAGTEDYDQILKTPRMIIDSKNSTVTRVFLDKEEEQSNLQ